MLPDFRIRQRDYLLEITQAITRELDPAILLKRIVSIAAEMLAGNAGVVALRGETGGWYVTAPHNLPTAFVRYLQAFLPQVQPTENPVEKEVPEIFHLLEEMTRSASRGLLTGVGLPLIAFERVIGVIFIFRSYVSSFSANDRALLQTFADQAAIAVHNAQLYAQVSHEKQRMDTLLDTVPDGILILTPNHIIERCNPAFSRLWHLPTSQIVGRSHEAILRWRNLQHGQTLEQAESNGWALNANTNLYVEGDVERPDGSLLPVGITYAPLFSATGEFVNIIASVRDITHFREAEAIKSTFISVVSHELKTPVALIKGYVATLRRDDAHWERDIIADSLAVIEEEADRLTELIENLLDASRLQAGGLKLNRAEVSLAQLAHRLCERFATQTTQHTFKIDLPPNFPVILADEDRLTQVFNNLLSNAIKYAPQGGEIHIGGQVRPEEVIVCISDQGEGIAASDAPHVFDRFYRAPEAARNTKGAGLGLFLTRAIIEAHHGRIWVDTRYTSGARICFTLPRET